MQEITVRRPDDLHVHLRDGDTLRLVTPFTAARFARATVMPNLQPPITTSMQAVSYRQRVRAVIPNGSPFTPLMTAYLTDLTDPKDIEEGFQREAWVAAK